MGARSDLRPDLHRSLLKLDELPPRSIVVSEGGSAWQESRGYWYRAFDAEGISSRDSTQQLGKWASLSSEENNHE